MKTLHLNLQKKWFDMILSGEKCEEYRAVSTYWKIRFRKVRNEGINTITFSNGYAKERRQMVVKLRYITVRTGIVDWGAEPDKVYIICHLGDVIKTEHCQEEKSCMTADEALQVLVEHNRWRRGEGDYAEHGASFPHTPKQIGRAIEIGIEALKFCQPS